MSVIKITGPAYCRLRAPDLDRMEQFLLDFGMVKAGRSADRLYMRGTDPTPYAHVTELGEPGLIGMAYHAASVEDLRRVSQVPGASKVEDIDAPGGGQRVVLRDPDGYQVEVVHGIAPVPAIPVWRPSVVPGATVGVLERVNIGPSRVKNIGHIVMFTPQLARTLAWYQDTLGVLPTEEVYGGSEDNVLGSFNRVDQGETMVDHHVAMFFSKATPGMNHVAFEVHDFDDVFTGREHLLSKNRYEPLYGIGKHLLGNQIFDYWGGPWGMVHEHFFGSDRLNVASGHKRVDIVRGFVSPWGGEPSQELLNRVTP